MADGGWGELGERIRQERSRRWPNRSDFARASGVSVRVLVDLEGGHRRNYQPETLAVVEAALGWEPGSMDRVRGGLTPLQREDPLLTRLRILWPRLDRGARTMLVEMAERASEA